MIGSTLAANWSARSPRTCALAAFAFSMHGERAELKKALAACKKHKAVLVIAKLDRLSRSSAFINNLMESGVEFVACDNPHANKLTIRILAAVAQHEREQIADR